MQKLMQKKIRPLFVLFVLTCFLLSGCKEARKETITEAKAPARKGIDLQAMLEGTHSDTSGFQSILYFTVEPMQLNFRVPALHSFAFGSYNGNWIFIGGQKGGFHGTSNNPVPFGPTLANDSIWVLNMSQQKSWSMAVAPAWRSVLSATNMAYCQVGNLLYMCGGYTNTDGTKPFNITSNVLLEIDLSQLVSIVQSDNKNVKIDGAVTNQVTSPFVQVTGGNMLFSNGYFYLVGGQNYNSQYSSGRTGLYTNAIRTFKFQQGNLTDTSSLVDSINLHRRDMNVVEGIISNRATAIIYGGVFTKRDDAFRSPVIINGMGTPNPSITVDSFQQQVNQYSCAVASIADPNVPVAVTSFFGGISHLMYDKDSSKLVVGDHGISMPFSNMASTIATGGGINNSKEYIQVPPYAPLLPKFLGANAIFIPLPAYSMADNSMILDASKIPDNAAGKAMVGYVFGGIISNGPTSGTTAKGFVPTYANPNIYQVYLNYYVGANKK
jgi:hypothetical protein